MYQIASFYTHNQTETSPHEIRMEQILSLAWGMQFREVQTQEKVASLGNI